MFQQEPTKYHLRHLMVMSIVLQKIANYEKCGHFISKKMTHLLLVQVLQQIYLMMLIS